jgi:predicted nucleic acid-binding protein
MAYLVDTNVLCESSKPNPDPLVIQWLASHDAELRVSALSIGEMLKGIHLMDAGKRRHDIERWFHRIEAWAANRLLALDAAVMATWGRFYADHQRNGRKLSLMDSLLAATALHHQLTIVTRNTGDFPDDVTLLNPWATPIR